MDATFKTVRKHRRTSDAPVGVRSRARFVLALVGGLSVLLGATLFLALRGSRRSIPVGSGAEREADVGPGDRADGRGRRHFRTDVRGKRHDVAPVQNASGRTYVAQAMVHGIRQLAHLRTAGVSHLEAQANQMDDYLLGVVDTIRASNPEVFGALAQQFEAELCGKEKTGDLDLLLFSRMSLLESGIATDRALNCALERRNGEDTVLWSLMNAWSNKGQPQIPAIASIQRAATDDRTRHLLLSPAERLARARQVPNEPSGRQAGEVAPTTAGRGGLPSASVGRGGT